MGERLGDAEARALLGVEPSASREVIRATYVRQAGIWQIRKMAATGALKGEIGQQEARLREACLTLLGELPSVPEATGEVTSPGSALRADDGTASVLSGSRTGEGNLAAGAVMPVVADRGTGRSPLRVGLLSVLLLTVVSGVAWLEFGPRPGADMSPTPIPAATDGLVATGPDTPPTEAPVPVSTPEPPPVSQDDGAGVVETPEPVPSDGIEEPAEAESDQADSGDAPESLPDTPAPLGETSPLVEVPSDHDEVGDGHDEARRAIVTALETWVRAVRDGDIEAFAMAYAPRVEPYFGKRSQTREAIRVAMAGQLAKYTQRRLMGLSGLEIVMTDPGVAEVTYRKEWDFRSANRRYAGAERERLKMLETADGWKISAETELEILWVRRGR